MLFKFRPINRNKQDAQHRFRCSARVTLSRHSYTDCKTSNKR